MNCTWTKITMFRSLFCDPLRKPVNYVTGTNRSNSTVSKSNNQYCVDLVRKCDFENYLATLLMPKDVQRAVFALRAFNVELAQVQDNVSEKNIGLMRMQFWKDALNNIFKHGGAPHTPVAKELAGASNYYDLSHRWLKRIVDARISEMERNIFPTVNSIEDHAEHINSSLYYLMLECLGVKNIQADHAASHLGKAQGLVTVLRGVPFHAGRRRVYLPVEKLAQHKVSQEDIIRGKTTQSVKDIVFDVASVAHQHLEKARSLRKDLPRKTSLAFLNSVVCDRFLKKLQKENFNIFHGNLQGRDNLLAYRMYVNKLRDKY